MTRLTGGRLPSAVWMRGARSGHSGTPVGLLQRFGLVLGCSGHDQSRGPTATRSAVATHPATVAAPATAAPWRDSAPCPDRNYVAALIFVAPSPLLGAAGRIDLERLSVDSFSLRAVKGGTRPAQTRSIKASVGQSCISPVSAVGCASGCRAYLCRRGIRALVLLACSVICCNALHQPPR